MSQNLRHSFGMNYDDKCTKFNFDRLLTIINGRTAVNVLAAIVSEMSTNNISHITVDEICKKTWLARQTVSKQITYLTKENAISVIPHKNDKRRNSYKVNSSWIWI